MYANRVIGEVSAPRWDDHHRDDDRRNSRRSRSRSRKHKDW
jgi:hypothetical protein